jgi:hypothetical protein
VSACLSVCLSVCLSACLSVCRGEKNVDSFLATRRVMAVEKVRYWRSTTNLFSTFLPSRNSILSNASAHTKCKSISISSKFLIYKQIEQQWTTSLPLHTTKKSTTTGIHYRQYKNYRYLSRRNFIITHFKNDLLNIRKGGG